ncbi:unnamed protein product, partial [Phaeothamnion confervicola]
MLAWTKHRFCGGKACLRCSEQCALRHKEAPIRGLHCDWITPRILAMQRPSTRLLDTYGIIDAFVEHGIGLVLNLTEPGEHPYCGDGLEEASGFPYLPESFMDRGVAFANFAWEDMTVPLLPLLRDIVRVGAAALAGGGKVAVHCHAGYGRTGLVIASLLVHTEGMAADKAIDLVRTRRPGSVQTSAQAEIVHKFADMCRGSAIIYHLTPHARTTLGQFLSQQGFFLHGDESLRLRWVPKPLSLVARMLTTLAAVAAHGTAAALA